MLRRITRLFHKAGTANPSIISSEHHPILPTMISKDAKKVVETLQAKGFEAYLVGGCIRDLLLNMKPKDFDVATDAEPAQVKALFRRSRIIGRRFQIVHVQFSRELIEVTTFRSNEKSDSELQGDSLSLRQKSKSGMLTRDNVFGNIDDDAARRDLTINALYYNPSTNIIYDFTGGLKDINNQIIRMIGIPSTRYREDPVRILRVIRFAAKLGFKIDLNTSKPMQKLGSDLKHVSPPRFFDECLKLFMNGNGTTTYALLKQYHLFDYIIPQAANLVADKSTNTDFLFEQAFLNTDNRIKSNKRVTPAFIFAVLLWPSVVKLTKIYQQKGNSPSYSIAKAGADVVSEQVRITAIPKRFTIPMREIWDLQFQLPRRGGKRASRLSEHPRFRAGYDFILLREQAGENLDGLGDWWTRYQDVDSEEKIKMSERAGKTNKKRRRKKNS